MNNNLQGFKSYKKQIDQIKGTDAKSFKNFTYMEGLMAVRKHIQEKRLKNDEVSVISVNSKEYLSERKAKYRALITQAVNELNLVVDEYSTQEFINECLSDIVGYSVLEEAFSDSEITDIFVNSMDDIWVEKAGKNVKYWRSFRSKQHYEETLERFLKEAGKEMNSGDKKICHLELYGDRGCSTDGSVSTKAPSITFRKHGYSVVTRQDLLDRGVMTEDMADLLGVIMQGEMNLTVAGLTGSGKTTSLQSLVNHYINNKRILIAEDTQELEIECDEFNNNNVLQLVSVKAKNEEETVTLEDLIHTALRLKPRTIIVGEIRAQESLAAVEAAETGHSVLFTIHGGVPMNVVNRLVTKYLQAMPSLGIEVVERIIGSALDYIMIQDCIPGVGRKVTSITEVGYDFEQRTIKLTTIYKFDFKTNSFVKVNNISEEKAEVMFRRGITADQLTRWMD